MAAERLQEPNRIVQIDDKRTGKVIIGSPTPRELDASTSFIPGSLEVSSNEGHVLNHIPLPDASFAVFGVHADDVEIRDAMKLSQLENP